jgi:hypothetical protein
MHIGDICVLGNHYYGGNTCNGLSDGSVSKNAVGTTGSSRCQRQIRKGAAYVGIEVWTGAQGGCSSYWICYVRGVWVEI